MSALRSYGDPCGIARALDVVGERWSLLVVRELAHGPRRFTDLRVGLTGASPNVLSQRLRELLGSDVVVQRPDGAYELTDWGEQLLPILQGLGRWGAMSPSPPRGELSVDALLVALESTFVAERALDLRATYALALGDAHFTVDIALGTIEIVRGAARRTDASISTDLKTFRAVVFGDRKLSDAPVELIGDKRLARLFFRLFERPTRAQPAE